MSLRWGIIATGGIANVFASDLRVAGLTATAVASRSVERASAFAAEHGIPRAYSSYAELIDDPNVDIVYIATPHPQHAEPALAAIAAGKHVLIEKAFTANAREARAIRDAAAANGVLAMEAMWVRYLPHMARVRDIVASGVLGTITGVIADHTRRLADDPAHRLNALELGGGALLDLAIYPISFTWDVLGAPSGVHAVATLRETGADATVATMFTYASGAVATTYSTAVGAGRNTATVLGTEASLFLDEAWARDASVRVVASDGRVLDEFSFPFDGAGLRFEAQAAERLVAAGAVSSDLLPIEETVAIMETLDEVRRQIGVVYPADSND